MENLLVTHHALDRVTERGISQAQVYAVLKNSDDLRPIEMSPVDSPRVDRIGGAPVDLRRRGEEFSW